MGFSLKKLAKKIIKPAKQAVSDIGKVGDKAVKQVKSSVKGHTRFLKSIGKTVQGMLNPGAAYADALAASQAAQPQETQIDQQALAENDRRRKRAMQTGGRQSTILTGGSSGTFGG